MIKIAMMGAGSAGFCRMLVEDAVSYEALSDAHFVLMDVDAERASLVHEFMERAKEQHDLKCTFSASTDRREALTDADFAISMIQVGSLGPYKHDVEIPMKYGVDQCVGDTVGPGGVFRGLRHVPALNDILATMEEVSKPGAIFMNYANPMAIVSWATQKAHPGMHSVGLCHGVQHTTHMLCKWLDVPQEECDVLTAGINHMAWFLTFRHQGRDLYPEMWEKLDKEGPIQGEEYRFEMMKAAGYFMTESPGHLSEYLPYFRKRQDIMDLFNGPGFSGESLYYYNSCVRGHARYWEQVNKWISGEEPVLFRKNFRSVEYAAGIMNAKVTDAPFRFAGNVLNKGYITNLPYDSCVEVPVYADRLRPARLVRRQAAGAVRGAVPVQHLPAGAGREGRAGG